ncbi:MAG: ATP synthase F1 subunit delta [Candidatus Taylorbacteria bacterium]|nr:ATP synthase F1 subunit delta [Candidatus Taylorbacteria bacterium]
MAKISTKNVAQAIYISAKDKNGAELEHTLGNVVEFLAKKNLLGKAPEILKRLEEIHNAREHIVRAKVSSKSELGKHAADELKRALKHRYKAEEIILDLSEDKTLLGGLKIEAKDEVIDLSLKNKLQQLQTHLLTN